MGFSISQQPRRDIPNTINTAINKATHTGLKIQL